MAPKLKKKRIYTVHEFAEELGVPQSSVRRWLKNGNLRGTKMGKKWLIPSSEIDRLVDPPQRKKFFLTGRILVDKAICFVT